MINTKELKKVMIDLDVTIYDIANLLGKSYGNVLNKINNRTPMTLSEAEKIQDYLEIYDEEFAFYFLNRVQNYD